MTDHRALQETRDRLAADIVENTCVPCKDKRGPLDLEDPLACGCCCSAVLPMLKRLAQLDQALSLTEPRPEPRLDLVLANGLGD